MSPNTRGMLPLLATATTPAPIPVHVTTGDGGWLAILTVLGTFIASIAAIVVVFLQPWWRDHRERKKRPRLSLRVAETAVEDVLWTDDDGDELRTAAPWLRLLVSNEGKRTAERATVFVLYWGPPGDRHRELRAPLKVTHESGVAVDIHPGMPRLVDFAWMRPAAKQDKDTAITLVVAGQGFGRRHAMRFLAHKESRVQVHMRVVADGADPIDYLADVWCSGSWVFWDDRNNPEQGLKVESLRPMP